MREKRKEKRKKTTYLEGQGGDGRADRHGERVDVPDHDDGSLVGDGLGPGGVRQRSPHLGVKGHVRVGDEVVGLRVARGDDRRPPKHGVAPVPTLRLRGGAPAVLRVLRELRGELGLSGIEDAEAVRGHARRRGGPGDRGRGERRAHAAEARGCGDKRLRLSSREEMGGGGGLWWRWRGKGVSLLRYCMCARGCALVLLP